MSRVKTTVRVVTELAPPLPDPDFERDDFPQPPAKRQKTSHAGPRRSSLASTKSKVNKTVRIDEGFDAPSGGSQGSDDAEVVSGDEPQPKGYNPLLRLLELPVPGEDAASGSSQSQSQNTTNNSVEEDDEGYATPPESSSESEQEQDEGDDTESEAEDLEDLAPRPQLVARDDQTAKGKFHLTRPKKRYDGTRVPSGPKHSVPSSINKFLRDYQRDGVQFFYKHYCEGRGAILGDDMGLGKTIQVISFLSAIMNKDNDRRDLKRRYNYVSKLQDELPAGTRLPPANSKWPTALIIAPTTLIGNWERELDTWGYFEYASYAGTPEQRKNIMTNFKRGRLDILLVSYDLVRKEIERFDDLALSCIFVDEVHKIKNTTSSTIKAFKQFKCQVRFGLTGTALQNDYDEMYPLLSWCSPGALGTKKNWKNTITRPLKIGASYASNTPEREYAGLVARALVDKLLPKFFLRRTKLLIAAQLPQKHDNVVFCPLTPIQLMAYQNFLNTEEVQLLTRKDEICDCEEGRREGKKRCKCCYAVGEDGRPWGEGMLRWINILVKAANHGMLLYPSDTDSPEQKAANRLLLQIAFPDQPRLRNPSAAHSPNQCGKFSVLKQLLAGWRSSIDAKNKVLIFSKTVKLLDFLELELAKVYGRDALCYLSGKTKKEDRMTIVDSFNHDAEKFIFLISTTAGGTGLNLTAANRVVIFDPHWNPAHDLQAMDRAYRYGQTRDVYVYRLIGAGSLEEHIYARQVYKQQMAMTAYEGTQQTRYFAGVQGDKNQQGELFGIKNLFKLHATAYETKHTVESARLEELEWALANVPKGADDVGDQALGAFLLDDPELGDVTLKKRPAEDKAETDLVSSIYSKTGVQYTHNNSHILARSRIVANGGKVGTKRKKKEPGLESPSKKTAVNLNADWPPKRKKHLNSTIKPRPPKTIYERQLKDRKKQLLLVGMIRDYHDDYRRFAVDFAAMPEREQARVIRRLDGQPEESGSDADEEQDDENDDDDDEE